MPLNHYHITRIADVAKREENAIVDVMAVVLHDSETMEVMINQKPQKITRLRVCDDSDGGTCMRVTIWEPEFTAKRGEIIALRCA